RVGTEEEKMCRRMQAVHEELRAIYALNTERLRAMVAEIGWPTRSKVGPAAEHVAWLLVQHADHNVAFQRHCLALMERESGDEVCANHLAYLEDRIRVAEGRPQRYGTQLNMTDHGLDVKELEDPANVDERRQRLGLEPIRENIQ